MYNRMGAFPLPPTWDLQRNIDAFHQREALTYTDAPNPLGYKIGSFRTSIYGQALDPVSPSYGRVNPLDPYMRADYLQGWWDAVTEGILTADETGAATFNYWLDQVIGGNPVPSDVAEFFHTLKDRNNIYAELNHLVSGILDGSISDHAEMAKMSPMIMCLGDLRKMAYIQQVGWPPNVALWSPSVAEVYNNTSGRITDTAYKVRLLLALFAAECDGYAEQAGIAKPFGGRWNDAMVSGLLGLSVPHAQWINDDYGHPVDVDAVPLPSLDPTIGGQPIDLPAVPSTPATSVPVTTIPPGTQPFTPSGPVLHEGSSPPPSAPSVITVHDVEYLDAPPVNSTGVPMKTVAIGLAAVAVAALLGGGRRR